MNLSPGPNNQIITQSYNPPIQIPSPGSAIFVETEVDRLALDISTLEGKSVIQLNPQVSLYTIHEGYWYMIGEGTGSYPTLYSSDILNDSSVTGSTVDDSLSFLWSSSLNYSQSLNSNIQSVSSSLVSHSLNVSNPHSVTKTQVGLGNVDDTRDDSKPVSTLQETRITLGDSTRAVEGWLANDGATSLRGIYQPLTARHDLRTATEASLAGWVRFPATFPSSDSPFHSMCLFAGSWRGPNSLNLALYTTGQQVRLQRFGATTSDFLRMANTGTLWNTYKGRDVFVEVQLDTTQTAAIYFDGVDVTADFAFSTGGTPPTGWLDGNIQNALSLTGGMGAAGVPMYPLNWINRYLIGTESDTLRLTGRWPADCLAGGSMVGGLSGDDSTFSTGVGSWVTDSNATITQSGGKGILEFTGTAGRISRLSIFPNGNIGARYRFQLKARLASGSLAGPLYFGNSGGTMNITFTPTGTEQMFSGEVDIVSGGTTTLRIGTTTNSTGAIIEIDDVQFYPVGLLSLPTVGPDRFVRDVTKMTPPIDGYLVGISPQTTIADGWIRYRITSSGYLFADTQLIGSNRGVVQVLIKSVSGGTVSLGESGGSPASIVASISLTAGVWTPCTILKSVISTGKLYGTLGTATDAQFAVRTGPIVDLT